MIKQEVAVPGQVTRFLQVILVLGGIGALAFGLLVPVATMVHWTELYVSSDGKLSEGGISDLTRLKSLLKMAGLGLIVLGVALTWVGPPVARVGQSIARRIDPGAIATAVVDRLGIWCRGLYAAFMREPVLWTALLVLLLGLGVAGFFLSPAGGFHVEGIDLQPAKNLARHGVYGTLTTRGFDELTYRSSAGPAIILPSALAYWLLGVNVYYSRAIALLFLIAAVFVFRRLALKLYDKGTAWLGTFLILPTFMMFNQGGNGGANEGYMPGFMWFMVGALCWFKAVEQRDRALPLWLAGIAWGVAFQTKWLFLFSLIALGVTWILLRISSNRLGHRYWLVPTLGLLGVSFAWTAFRIGNVGLRTEVTHLRDFWMEHGFRAVGTGTDTALVAGLLNSVRPVATLAQVDLFGELQLFLLVPAVVYVMVGLFRSKLADYRTLFLLAFGGIWFLWWFLFNFDLVWDHLLVPRFVGTLFIAKLLIDGWRALGSEPTGFTQLLQGGVAGNRLWAYVGRVAIVALVLTEVLVPLISRTNTIYVRYHTTTKPYLEMVQYLRTHTEKNAVFSGWSWSLPFYLDLDPAGDHITKDRKTYPMDQRESVPEYFIVSPEFPLVKTSDSYPNASVDNAFNRRNNEERMKFVTEHCEFIKSFGSRDHHWDVYRVRDVAPAPAPGPAG